MMMIRNLMATAGALATLALMTAAPVAAQKWPTDTVRVIVPFTAGSATDLVPRIVFEEVQKQTGQTFIVDNRPGGAFTLGVNPVMRAEPDGKTILVHSNAFITTPAVQPVTWDPSKDFAGVTPLASVPQVLVIAPSKKIDTVQELVKLARAKPGSLNYAAAGIGSPPHMTMERFRLAADFTGQLVPFKGAPEALNEVAAGRVDVYFSPAAPAMGLIKSGQLKPLAVSSLKRSASFPDVPTTTEAGFKGSDFDFYVSMFVPKKTSPELIKAMHAVIAKALASETVQKRLAQIGAEPALMDSAAFDKRIAEEAKIAMEIAKTANISAAKPK